MTKVVKELENVLEKGGSAVEHFITAVKTLKRADVQVTDVGDIEVITIGRDVIFSMPKDNKHIFFYSKPTKWSRAKLKELV